jgi:hypothetical protein
MSKDEYAQKGEWAKKREWIVELLKRRSGHSTTQEIREALRMLEDALGEAQIDEPEELVRLLLFLSDNFDHAGLKATVQTLVRAAFDNSIVHAIAFEDYVEAIRGGQNPLKIVRAALREAEHGLVNSETEPPNNCRGGQYG